MGSAENVENVGTEEDVEASVGDSVVGTVVAGEASGVVTVVTVVVSVVGTMASGEVVMVNTVVGEEGVVDADVDEASQITEMVLELQSLPEGVVCNSFLGGECCII